jgi:hypothetical protein
VLRLALALSVMGCHVVFPLEDLVVEPPRGPIAHYAFETDVLVDSSGSNHHGSCSFCPQISTAGRVGNAAQFDGKQLIEIAHRDAFIVRDGVTVALWVKLEGVPRAGCPISKPFGVAIASTWELCLADGRASFSSTSRQELQSEPISDPDAWHHYVLRGDKPNEFNDLWIDGNVVAGGEAQAFQTDSNPILIGADTNGGVPLDFVTGFIDEVYIFDRALAADEIAALAEPDE